MLKLREGIYAWVTSKEMNIKNWSWYDKHLTCEIMNSESLGIWFRCILFHHISNFHYIETVDILFYTSTTSKIALRLGKTLTGILHVEWIAYILTLDCLFFHKWGMGCTTQSSDLLGDFPSTVTFQSHLYRCMFFFFLFTFLVNLSA